MDTFGDPRKSVLHFPARRTTLFLRDAGNYRLVVVKHFMPKPLKIVRHDEPLDDGMAQKMDSKEVRAPQPLLITRQRDPAMVLDKQKFNVSR